MPTRANYQMDTRALGPNGTYQWDTGIVSAPQLQLGANELALLGCTNDCRATPVTTFLPVLLEQPAGQDAAGFLAVVLGRRDLDSVRYELLREGRSLGQRTLEGPFYAERPVSLDLGAPPGGTYTLRVLAIARDGTRGPLSATIRLPGRP